MKGKIFISALILLVFSECICSSLSVVASSYPVRSSSADTSSSDSVDSIPEARSGRAMAAGEAGSRISQVEAKRESRHDEEARLNIMPRSMSTATGRVSQTEEVRLSSQHEEELDVNILNIEDKVKQSNHSFNQKYIAAENEDDLVKKQAMYREAIGDIEELIEGTQSLRKIDKGNEWKYAFDISMGYFNKGRAFAMLSRCDKKDELSHTKNAIKSFQKSALGAGIIAINGKLLNKEKIKVLELKLVSHENEGNGHVNLFRLDRNQFALHLHNALRAYDQFHIVESQLSTITDENLDDHNSFVFNKKIAIYKELQILDPDNQLMYKNYEANEYEQYAALVEKRLEINSKKQEFQKYLQKANEIRKELREKVF